MNPNRLIATIWFATNPDDWQAFGMQQCRRGQRLNLNLGMVDGIFST